MIRPYRGPQRQPINQPRIGNILDPLGDARKWTNVWGAVMNVPQPSGGAPVSPTPTPTNTQTPTPTPTASITPTPSITPTNTPTPSITPTITSTNTPTPSITPTKTATPTPTPSPLVSSVSYITAVSSQTETNSFTFNNTNIGGSGLIVLTIQSTGGSAVAALSSVSVNGSAATAAVQRGPTGGPSGRYALNEMWYIQVNSGTTANIVITYSQNQKSCIVGVYRLQNISSNTPTQVNAGDSNVGLTCASLTSLPSNSLVVACATESVVPFTITNTTTNYSETFDYGGGSSQTFVGASTKTSGNLTLCIEDGLGGFSNQNIVSAAWA